MNRSKQSLLKKSAYVAGTASALALVSMLALPLAAHVIAPSSSWLITSAHAEDSTGKKQNHGATSSKGKGGSGTTSGKGTGKADSAVKASESTEEDSDRPAWAKGNTAANPHISGSQGQPGTASTKKGDLFGDLWVLLRNDDGTPVYVKWVDTNNDGVNDTMQTCSSSANCFVQPVDASGNPIPLDAEGAPIDATLVQEVELGRTNISRSPTKVLDHSLTEALSKLDGLVLGDTVTQDAAGRLVVDGVAIDSPLENLALYKALLLAKDTNHDGNLELTITSTGENGTVTYTFLVPTEDRLDLAAALFAAAADKTGVITVDQIYDISAFLGVSDELSKLVTSYTYDRTDTYGDTNITVLVLQSDGVTYKVETLPVIGTVTFNAVPSYTTDSTNSTGIDVFAQAADDSLQVLEYVHDNAPK